MNIGEARATIEISRRVEKTSPAPGVGMGLLLVLRSQSRYLHPRLYLVRPRERAPGRAQPDCMKERNQMPRMVKREQHSTGWRMRVILGGRETAKK